MKYIIKTSESFGDYIIRIDDDGTEWSIPEDKANSDYQKYLKDTKGGLPSPSKK